jgi:hypothetical protein
VTVDRLRRTTLQTLAALPITTGATFTRAADEMARPNHRSDAAADWAIKHTIALVVRYQLNPLRAARALAYVSGSSADVWRADENKNNVAATANHAAATLIEHLFPQEPVGRARAMSLARFGPRDPHDLRSAANRWIERALQDGSNAIWRNSERPTASDGLWRGYAPLYAFNPVEPLAGNWQTLILPQSGAIDVAPPAAFNSTTLLAEATEVLAITKALTAQQKAIAERWHLEQGSPTPAGVWNTIALDLLQRERVANGRKATILATLNAAMFDALVACWRVKYAHWTPRPITVIQAKLDAAFSPHLVTPPFPGYASGHASASGAAERVLAAAMPVYAAELKRLADEAAMSRLYGGIHFRSDNDAGLLLGRRIGDLAAQRPIIG